MFSGGNDTRESFQLLEIEEEAVEPVTGYSLDMAIWKLGVRGLRV